MTIAEILESKNKKTYEKITGKKQKLCYNEDYHPLEKETRGQWLNRLKNES